MFTPVGVVTPVTTYIGGFLIALLEMFTIYFLEFGPSMKNREEICLNKDLNMLF